MIVAILISVIILIAGIALLAKEAKTTLPKFEIICPKCAWMDRLNAFYQNTGSALLFTCPECGYKEDCIKDLQEAKK